MPAAIPAATVLLIRDGDEGVETLMLRRDSKLAFAGGMWVFPGGRVDAEDYPPDAPDDVEAAVLTAAVREAHEESGLEVERDSLVAFSHWTPPAVAIKRYATWFFLAPAPAGAVVIDDGEIRDHFWARPADVHAAPGRGRARAGPTHLGVARRPAPLAPTSPRPWPPQRRPRSSTSSPGSPGSKAAAPPSGTATPATRPPTRTSPAPATAS